MTATISRNAQLVKTYAFVCSIVLTTFLIFEKCSGFVLSEVAFQQLRLGLRQIYEDQAVQGVGEFGIDVEAQQFSAEPQILAQQHRNSGLLLDIADQRG